MTNQRVVILSPFLIITVNFGLAFLFGQFIGKWAFIPMISIGWVLWLFFILKFGGTDSIRNWLKKPTGKIWWGIFAILIGLIPLPLFIFHHDTLSEWIIWLPWIILALINPWIEEFYWRGLLLDFTSNWSGWAAVLYSSILFALNHAAFGLNSELNGGFEIVNIDFNHGNRLGICLQKDQKLKMGHLCSFLGRLFWTFSTRIFGFMGKGYLVK